MAGNHSGVLTLAVESTSEIVIERNIFSRKLRRTPCFIIFQYNKQEQRVDDILTPCSSTYHKWNKEVSFQIDPTYGDCVWVNMYRDNNRVIGKCDIILSDVPDENQRPFRRTFMLKKYMPSASNEGDVQGFLKVCVTFNRHAQEAPYPPSYPQQWPRPQPPQQPMYPPGPRQPWQISQQQQPYGPFHTPQDQWQNGPPAPQPIPNPHPGPLYPPNNFHMSDDRGNYHQAPHPGARPNLSDIPIADIFPPPISYASSWSHHHHHTPTDPFVWSPAEQQENQAPLASASTGTDDEEDDSEMRNLFEAFVPV